jgi:hypothetical protein
MEGKERSLPFSEDGQKHWNEWHTEFCNLMSDDSLPYYLRNVLSKMEGYTARFALILEFSKCAEAGVEAEYITIESLEGAIKLTEYFISNVSKVRNSFASSALDKKVDRVVAWLKKQKSGSANSRKVYTNRVAGIKSAQEVYEVFMEMKSRGVGQMHVQGDGLGGNQKVYQFILNSNYLINNQTQNNNG